MQNLKRVDYWAMALLLTVVAGAADLIVKHDPIGQSWERQQVQKSLTWMPKTCPSSLGPPHQSPDNREGSIMEK